MGHKAFVFDTQTFHKMIEPIMAASVNNPETARQFICEHLDLLSLLTQERLWTRIGKTSLTNSHCRSTSTFFSQPAMMPKMI